MQTLEGFKYLFEIFRFDTEAVIHDAHDPFGIPTIGRHTNSWSILAVIIDRVVNQILKELERVCFIDGDNGQRLGGNGGARCLDFGL